MSTLIVEKIELKKSFDWGNSYSIIGKLDGELETVDFASKPIHAPRVGDSIEGTVETTQWGKKFKKQPSGGFKGPFTPRPEDPEKQKMIVRQNSLGNAIQFLMGAVEHKAKTKDDLTTDNVLLIAEKFAKFSLGELTAKPKELPPENHDFDDIEQYLPEE